MESGAGASVPNWSEAAEDLVHDGDVDGAVNLLEAEVSNLESQLRNNQEKESTKIVDELCAALRDLSKAYSAGGFSLKADQALSRALQIKHRKGELSNAKDSTQEDEAESPSTNPGEASLHDDGGNGIEHQDIAEDDDWEAAADRAPEELLSVQTLQGVSKLSLEDSAEAKATTTRRRGRGTFSYNKHGLYSDNQDNEEPSFDASEENIPSDSAQDAENRRNSTYGSRHVLVLADFPPSTRTTDLEKAFGRFKDQFVVRWVNDTTALAVFRTPSAALEARNSVQCPFTMRLLDEEDELLRSISPRDLEPPRQRPPTSVRTAQRLIAQGMGIRLPSTVTSSSAEFRRQEEARRNRIVSRQNMRDDAWGRE